MAGLLWTGAGVVWPFALAKKNTAMVSAIMVEAIMAQGFGASTYVTAKEGGGCEDGGQRMAKKRSEKNLTAAPAVTKKITPGGFLAKWLIPSSYLEEGEGGSPN